MEIYATQSDTFDPKCTSVEFNEAWTVKDEEDARRDFCERLDVYEVDEDGLPF